MSSAISSRKMNLLIYLSDIYCQKEGMVQQLQYIDLTGKKKGWYSNRCDRQQSLSMCLEADKFDLFTSETNFRC